MDIAVLITVVFAGVIFVGVIFSKEDNEEGK